MTRSEFQDLAVQGARAYCSYLDQYEKGVQEVRVAQIIRIGENFRLALRTRLKPEAMDSLLFKCQEVIYNSHEIKPILYNDDTASLEVRPVPKLFEKFSQLGASEVEVLSDLKFLVKRVEDWYHEYGRFISAPVHCPTIKQMQTTVGGELSEEQRAAIEGALSNPLSYIWGAPGTGKTRFVLANCVLNCVRAGEHVLLVAPTNNALEQMLFGILPEVIEAGISEDSVLRMGTPSHKFANLYPQCCEVVGISNKIKVAQSDRAFIEKCLKFWEFRTRFQETQTLAPKMLYEYFDLLDEAEQYRLKASSLYQEGTLQRSNQTILRHEANALRQEIDKLQATAKRKLFRRSNQRTANLIDEKVIELKRIAGQLNEITTECDAIEKRRREYVAFQGQCVKDAEQKKIALQRQCAFWPKLANTVAGIDYTNAAECVSALSILLRDGEEMLNQREIKYAAYQDDDDNELLRKLNELDQKIEKLEAETAEERMKDVAILALTADRFLVTFTPGKGESFKADHIFMDEAGYCSLIKGASLLSLGAPVTFLGDHMQLPPICEMPEEELEKAENKGVFLFSQSAIYVEQIFTLSQRDLLMSFIDRSPAPFLTLKKYDLTATYRFGISLSNILARSVYTPRFHSAAAKETQLFTVHAEKRPGQKKKENPSEVAAIVSLLPDISSSDYAILSFYRNQTALLSKALPKASKDERIMTVHASQGREWDTLVLSVSDTSEMWFTNSKNPKSQGKKVINTAVSRAKRRLIIVCDCNFWASKPDQLIGQLVLASQKYEPQRVEHYLALR